MREITDYTGTEIDNYVERANQLNEKNEYDGACVGSILIALAIMVSAASVHAIAKRNEDIFHNNALFSIISKMWTMFMIYDLLEDRVEYISDNAERISGFPWESYKTMSGSRVHTLTMKRSRGLQTVLRAQPWRDPAG